jgi:hypothetical protein
VIVKVKVMSNFLTSETLKKNLTQGRLNTPGPKSNISNHIESMKSANTSRIEDKNDNKAVKQEFQPEKPDRITIMDLGKESLSTIIKFDNMNEELITDVDFPKKEPVNSLKLLHDNWGQISK